MNTSETLQEAYTRRREARQARIDALPPAPKFTPTADEVSGPGNVDYNHPAYWGA